jgi:phosphoribosylglycinamide formyltransferase-1
VHNAVVEAKEQESGPTIHFVNENYDEGAIIEQYKCKIDAVDSPEDVQRKVLELEHKYFARCIEKIIENGI